MAETIHVPFSEKSRSGRSFGSIDGDRYPLVITILASAEAAAL